MGNELKITQIFNQISNQQLVLSKQEILSKIKEVNQSFQQNQQILGLRLFLDDKKIKYDRKNWKRTIVYGEIVVNRRKNLQKQSQQQMLAPKQQIFSLKQQQHEPKAQQQLSYQLRNQLSKRFPITISVDDLISIHQQVINLSSMTMNKMMEQQQTPTPQGEQQEECCICLQNKTSMVLPCSVCCLQILQHAFCDKCTFKYIIEAQEKKCPQCRHEIKGNRETVGRQIFTVVQDEQVYEQVTKDTLHVISRMNPETVNKIKQFIKTTNIKH